MVSVSEVFKSWQEGFTNKDSSRLAELLTDDFRFVSRLRDMGNKRRWIGLPLVATRRYWIIWKCCMRTTT